MPKLSLFNGTRPSAIAVVDQPVPTGFSRKARIAFWICSVAGAIVTTGLMTPRMNLVLSLILGAVIGGVIGLVAGAVLVAWPVVRSLWHWSLEITVAIAVYGVLAWLSNATAPWVAVVALVVIVIPVAVPRVRAPLVALAWCAIVRHRLRMSFAQFIRSAGPTGRAALPLILLARPTPAGERVWLWLRPGLALTDLEPRLDKVAVACWASEARVVRASARYAALVRVDITRRDPLTALVVSPLSMLPPRNPSPAASPSVGLLSLDLDDIPDIDPIPVSAGRSRTAGTEGS